MRHASLEGLGDGDTQVGCLDVRAGAWGSARPLSPSPPWGRDPRALVVGLPVGV